MRGAVCKECKIQRAYEDFRNSINEKCNECKRKDAIKLKLEREDRQPINERYYINRSGEVFKNSGLEIKPRLDKNSLVLRIDGLLKTVSGLIMKAYHPEKPKGHAPSPIDGNHMNVSAHNWEWAPTGRYLKELAREEKALDSDEFWELTEAQKKHYSTFLSLIRIPKTQTKGRRCLGCRQSMSSQNKHTNNYLCKECKDKVNRHGLMAQCTY